MERLTLYYLGKAAPQDSSEGEDAASPLQRRKLSALQNSTQRRTLVQAQAQNRLVRRLPPQRIADSTDAEGRGEDDEEEKDEEEGKDQGLYTRLLPLPALFFVCLFVCSLAN